MAAQSPLFVHSDIGLSPVSDHSDIGPKDSQSDIISNIGLKDSQSDILSDIRLTFLAISDI
jgi:hypothetical protein